MRVQGNKRVLAGSIAAAGVATLLSFPASAGAVSGAPALVGPDLIATRISAPASMPAGAWETNTVITVLNQGNGPSVATRGQLKLVTPGPALEADSPAMTGFEIPALGPGQSAEVLSLMGTPINFAGFYYLGAYVDSAGFNTELNEANNINPLPTGTRGNVQFEAKLWEVRNTNDFGISAGLPSVVESPIQVANVGFGGMPSPTKVFVQIFHTNRGDLKLELVGPANQVFLLEDIPNGDSGDNVIKTYSVLMNASMAGTWKLRVSDDVSGNGGFIDQWSMSAR